jgi:hypothetical protein
MEEVGDRDGESESSSSSSSSSSVFLKNFQYIYAPIATTAISRKATTAALFFGGGGGGGARLDIYIHVQNI